MSTHPFVSVPVVYESRQYKWVVANLDWEPDTGASGSGGAGDASAANQVTQIAALGATTDAEATADGSIIAVLKRIRTLLGGSLSVTGAFWQSVQPVSAASLPLPTGASTETTLGTRLSESDFDSKAGSLTETAPASDTASSGLNGRLQRVAQRLTSLIALLPASLGQKTMSASLAVVIASDQGAVPTTKVPTGGTNILKTGTLTTTAVTADQVVLTYTVTVGKTFYLTYLVMYGRLTVLAATATILGAISLETPSGTKTITFDDVNPTTSELEFNPLVFSEPIPIAASTVVRVVVTPAAATSMLWRANFGGYEK